MSINTAAVDELVGGHENKDVHSLHQHTLRFTIYLFTVSNRQRNKTATGRMLRQTTDCFYRKFITFYVLKSYLFCLRSHSTYKSVLFVCIFMPHLLLQHPHILTLQIQGKRRFCICCSEADESRLIKYTRSRNMLFFYSQKKKG